MLMLSTYVRSTLQSLADRPPRPGRAAAARATNNIERLVTVLLPAVKNLVRFGPMARSGVTLCNTSASDGLITDPIHIPFLPIQIYSMTDSDCTVECSHVKIWEREAHHTTDYSLSLPLDLLARSAELWYPGSMMKLAMNSGQAACGCARCGVTFASLSLFDRHQSWDGPELDCQGPEALGLVEGTNHTWMTPGAAERIKDLPRRRAQG